MIKNWLKIFLYHFNTNKFFTILNTLGLSLGIAGLIFAILYWNDEHAYNAWNPEKDTVFQVVNDLGEGNIWATNIAPTGSMLKTSAPNLSDYCYLDENYYNEIMSYKGKRHLIGKISDAQKNFFSFFPFQFVKGNAATALSPATIAISEQTAKLIFGDDNAMGKQVLYAGRNFTVNGVYRIPGKSSFAPMVVTNLIDPKLAENMDQWGNFNHGLLLKLKNPGRRAEIEKAIEKIYFENRTAKWAKEEGITPEEFEQKHGKTTVSLPPLSTLRLHAEVGGGPEGKGNFQFLMIMVGLSILILILSITNYVNLATANAIKRAKEVGVRKILGASKANIVWQFIFETVITTLISILLSLVIVELSLPYYNQFLAKELIIHGASFYLQLIAIFGIVVIVAGIFPSVYVANFETLKVLKGNFGRSKSGVWLRNGMLILQFSIASFFIVGSYVVYSQVKYMSTKDTGFKGDQILQVYYRNPYNYKEEGFRERLVARYETIKQELSKMKGVKTVSTGSFAFGTGTNSSSGFTYNDTNIQGQNMVVDYDMLDMLKINMVIGRNFSPQFSSDTTESIMLNETAVRMMNEKDPIGKFIEWNDKKLKIIGVVADFHINGLEEEIPPMTFFHYKTVNWLIQNVNNIYIKVDPIQMDESLPQIEKFWTTKVDTEYPFKYDFVDKSFARTFQAYINQKNVFSLLNVIVILIALFGLFALASYSIQRRMKELAIRKTLGAETTILLRELSKQYVLFCIIGFVITIFPAWFLMGKWLDTFAYRINMSVIPFLIGFIVLLALTLIVVLSKAYQATRSDVLKYLKYE